MTGHELAFDTTDDGTVARCSCAGFESPFYDGDDARRAGAHHLARALLDRLAKLRAEQGELVAELLEVFGVMSDEVQVGARS
jgi:class 3 adenylate cyclase